MEHYASHHNDRADEGGDISYSPGGVFGVTSHRDAGQTSKLLASQGLMLEAEQRDV